MDHTNLLAPATLPALIAARAARRPGAVAIEGIDGPPLTYRALHREIVAIGARLRQAGVGPRDRVAVVLPNGPEMAVAFLGVSSVAACAPLNPGYTATELEFYLADLAATALIVGAGAGSPARAVAAARGITILELPRWGAGVDGSPVPSATPAPDDVALVLHTSGTTSRPKMIPLSHANLRASARSIGATLRLREDDRCLNVMPLFHIHGLVGALLASLAAGGRVVCTPGFSPVHFFPWLDERAPTWYTAVPTMHQEVLARAHAHGDTIARSRLRFIRSASAALPAEVMTGLERLFDAPVIEAYGMTEASHQIASNPLPPGVRKPGSVGPPAGSQVAILDEAGRRLAPGESGEIAIRGANVTIERGGPTTEDPHTPSERGGPTTEDPHTPSESSRFEWLRTGDLGSIDEDGYVFIAGRLKEIINRAGEKIAPREVDDALLRHPGVAEVVTCGVPDPRLGEDVMAVVVRQPGATVSERELRDFASTHLAAFKVPRRVKFVDHIPKGPTGKIQRIGLATTLGIDAATLAQPGDGTPFVPPRTPTESVVAAAWREVLKLDQVGLHDNFFELGGDSLASMEVIAAVDERLGVKLGIRELAFGTLQQVAAACEETRVMSITTTIPRRRVAGNLLRGATRPLVKRWPIDRCPGWLGTLHHIRVPGNVEPNPRESPAGGANARIVFRLLAPALALAGDVAECGVWQGQMLLSMGLFVRQRRPGRQVFGFDSFAGLDGSVAIDAALGGDHDGRKMVGGFSDTSHEALMRRIRQYGLVTTVRLVRGYFEETLRHAAHRRFCFVHLDCVLYESYRECLEFFYPRMAAGGIMLLDEYHDPPWPGCTRAVDEFMQDKREAIESIVADNHVKYYIRRR